MARIWQKAKTILGICLILSAGGHAAFLAAAHLQTEAQPELVPLPWAQARSVQLDAVALPEIWQQPEPEIDSAAPEPSEPLQADTAPEPAVAATSSPSLDAPPAAPARTTRRHTTTNSARPAAPAPHEVAASAPIDTSAAATSPAARAIASSTPSPVTTSADGPDMPSGIETPAASSPPTAEVGASSASGETVLRGAAAARYLARVRRVLGAPPAPVGAQGEEGTVELLVVLDDRGRVLEVRVITSSGHRILDDSALAWLQNRRLPRPPRDLRDDRVAFAVPIQYVAG